MKQTSSPNPPPTISTNVLSTMDLESINQSLFHPNMDPPPSLPLIITIIITTSLLPSLLHCQQPYEGLSITDCNTPHNSTSLLGYFCNASPRSCPAYLTFHSQPSYQSVAAIAAHLGSDPSQLSHANSVASDASFPLGTKVIVPVNCSCSGGYYQSNSSYLVQGGDTAFIISNSTYQGLSTCQVLQAQNNGSSLLPGRQITVPLRCACPTANQTRSGAKYLLSYLVDSGDTIYLIGAKFGVTQDSIIAANELPNTLIYPFTTILVPLTSPPNSSQLVVPVPPPPPTISSPPAKKSSSHIGLYVGISVAAVVLVVIGSAFVLIFLKRKKKKAGQVVRSATNDDSEMFCGEDGSSTGVFNEKPGKDIGSRISEISHALKVYKFEELQLATENFSLECRIAGSSVYRGVFNGDVAAVKMMSRDVSSEIELLKRISHHNLITLSGVCFDQGRWYLVYEYARNGSLGDWLFNRSGSMVLSWVQRVQIALDVANGLNYLHSYTEPAYVHKDVNSSNVLLDDKFRAKIANFGNARPAEEGEILLTKHIVGTIGYMAPEYLEHGFVSPMLDVYAFGAVMMEIVTGRGVADVQRGGDGMSMEAFTALLGEEDAREKLGVFMDPLLKENYPVDLALIMARLIDGCLRADAWSRPSMEEVSQSLSRTYAASLSWAALNNGS